MSYREYVVAAYAVFFAVLLWDLVAPRLQIRRQLRAAQLRAARSNQANATPTDLPLSRN